MWVLLFTNGKFVATLYPARLSVPFPQAASTGFVSLSHFGSAHNISHPPPAKRLLHEVEDDGLPRCHSCPTLCDPTDSKQPTRLPRPWDSPGKNTGVGCHFLLQCMKVKSDSEVTQLRPTLGDPMDCSLPGSPVLGILQARVLEWGAIAFSNA